MKIFENGVERDATKKEKARYAAKAKRKDAARANEDIQASARAAARQKLLDLGLSENDLDLLWRL